MRNIDKFLFKTTIGKCAAVVAFLMAWAVPAMAQDYTGIYYIASGGRGAGNSATSYTYNSSSPANNFYLCPTEGWCFYAPVDDFTGTDNGMPFLTTYKCRTNAYHSGNPSDAIWTIEKAPNSSYYYIKQTSTGKYLLSNGQIRTTDNPDRIRVHLQLVDDLSSVGDNALFTIVPSNGTSVFISPKGITDGSSSAHTNHENHKWLTVNNGNYNYLTGQSGKTGGPEGYRNTAGIVGIYTQDDVNAPFYLEPATIDPPTITNNFDGTITITSETGATIYYTTDGSTPTTSTTTTGTTSVNVTLTDEIRVIKAIAKGVSDFFPTLVRTYNIPTCERPVITVSNNTATITCPIPGASIYYTTDNTQATPSSTPYGDPFSTENVTVIRAVATKPGYLTSNETFYSPAVTVYYSSDITDMNGRYVFADNFTSTASIGTASEPFQGQIDGNMVVLEGLDHALVAYAQGAIIKNVMLDNVTISNGTNVGAICNEATGDSRIYNCGVLASNSTVETDENGYTTITSCSSTIRGSDCVGGLVGLLDDESRVINCFSYADITGGDLVGGIVGKNNVATTSSNLKTMVMNCMFYGDFEVDACDSIAPIYNGEIITNDGDENGVNNFNYFRSEASYVQNQDIDVYNCALAAETRFLQRFEFFRHLLNSNRTLAAWWATGSRDNKDEMLKWVMEPGQIGTTTPYPILKTPGEYPSVVNYTPNDMEIDDSNEYRNEGRKLTNLGTNGKLSVTIQMGTQGSAPYGAPTGAGLKNGQDSQTVNLVINDKDPAHFNFNYGNVRLPYYNDYCTKNYNGNRVVTGWKITSITGGTQGSFNPTVNTAPNDAPNWNFADRNCTNKDLYGTNGSNRIFNQGAYWDVPEGVTAITIEPYWAKCVYLADSCLDVVYKNSGNDAMATASSVTTVGNGLHYHNGNQYSINGEDQVVYTTFANAVGGVFYGVNENTSNTQSVYDYAIVLIGNCHHTGLNNNSKRPFTVMSADLDFDNEPDANLLLRFNSRSKTHPARYDFINLIGLGMAQKTKGGNGTYNFGIMQPLGWFEVTNTALFRCTQFEYSCTSRVKKPIILQGGVVEQWVTVQNKAGDRVSYFHVGGNVWFKEFHRGTHQDQDQDPNAEDESSTPHPPISVTGGDYDEFYLTGLYQPKAIIYDDNAECYINGGRFGVMAGAGMEGIGVTEGNGNITWIIDNADINEFYGGGINANKPVFGNISTTISNSHVDSVFCGGPKFGDMEDGRTVTTTATDCTFKTFFGAGYGGNSYSRRAPFNRNNIINLPSTSPSYNSWNAWVNSEYTQKYDAAYGGVETQINYQFIPHSSNIDNVARLWIEYVGFSLATTHTVSSTLTGCTVTDNFYGGGSLGKVDVSVTSVLDSCKVKGNVFGAGFSVNIPPVKVMNLGGFEKEPHYDEQAGVFLDHKYKESVPYTWEHRDIVNSTETAINTTAHKLYTTEDLGALGTVAGNVSLTIKGESVIGTEGDSETGHVFGGGDQSAVTQSVVSGNPVANTGNTTVNIQEGARVLGNVYGGGNMGSVGGDSNVIIQNDPEP